jgi:hypothetical protein
MEGHSESAREEKPMLETYLISEVKERAGRAYSNILADKEEWPKT